jgi:hypothetical protein
MGFVTGPTGPTPAILVHVEIVEVEIAIAKIRQLRGPLGLGYRLVMTTVAESVVFLLVRGIENGWIGLGQEPEVIAAVGIVTAAAALLLDRTVQELLVLDFLGKGFQYPTLVQSHRFVVTLQTEGGRIVLE